VLHTEWLGPVSRLSGQLEQEGLPLCRTVSRELDPIACYLAWAVKGSGHNEVTMQSEVLQHASAT
jgi:hypothetical protein